MTPTDESDQVLQRRANLDELKKLGVDPYPRRFEPEATIDEIVNAHGAKSGEELEAAQIKTRTAGRILAIRSFGESRIPGRSRVSRSRDPDDAGGGRRRAGAAVQDAPQRARHATVHARGAGAVFEAPARGRHGARVRDQPQFQERGDVGAAQP